MPDSIRFWKRRIEETDAEKTFTVGLICGPSGCGKSSLVKAGLLPHVSDDIMKVYVEATADETEVRLLNGLRKCCPALPENLGLKEILAALRRGQGIPFGKKILIVIDQFEQWLHAKKEEQNTELVQALRQCDSGRVQCIVMVRDDFWMAIIRFMRELEIRLVEGQNSAAVDLFDTDHSRKVLAALGRAFGKLPESPSETTEEQKTFLKQAVSGLAREGKVISVRLALFADMMKGKTWNPASLKEVGGAEGVGITFLEETFGAASAPPEHRFHQKAARNILRALLPEAGTDIKGHMRWRQELMEVSGYANRPKDFDDLVRILDSEIRLITPTDPDGKDDAAENTVQAGAKYYQLTHDYLVHSLRDWLTRKQKETRRGRAELLLADRAAVWNARPESRQLPSLVQWVQIVTLVPPKNWTAQQRRMMTAAGRYHSGRGVLVAFILGVAALVGMFIRGRVIEQRMAAQAAGLVQRLLDAEIAKVPVVITDMSEYRKWIDPLLRQEYQKTTITLRQKLNTSIALLPVDPSQVLYLHERLLIAEPPDVAVIRDALGPYEDTLVARLWKEVESPSNESHRLRAAAALASYAPSSEKWAKTSTQIANDLVLENSVYMRDWSEAFWPVRSRLIPPLSSIFRDRQIERAAERTVATSLLADYASDQPKVLADLVLDADERQFSAVYPKLTPQDELVLTVLRTEIDRKLPLDASDEAREVLAKRQANAAIVLFKMGHPETVWPLLKHSTDPTVRSYLVHRLSPLRADSKVIINRLGEETDLTIQRALMLSLGEYDTRELSANDRNALIPKLQALYRNEPDPGIHSTTEWLLRVWKQDDWLKEVNELWAKDKDHRDQRLVRGQKEKQRTWYVNSEGQSLIVIPSPNTLEMGSPSTEKHRVGGPAGNTELPHRMSIERTFAISSKHVTLQDFMRFRSDHHYNTNQFPNAACPAGTITWYDAVAYCNWLNVQEGITQDEWCFQPNAKGEYAPDMSLAKDYLHRTGYRLLTEAEWELACRASSVKSRYYGEADSLVTRYAWCGANSKNRAMPVGLLKPNDWGLFDMHGNVWCWCQDPYIEYSELPASNSSLDSEFSIDLLLLQKRVLRGGSFFTQPVFVRSAARYHDVPTHHIDNVGFRLARTISR